MAANHVQDVAAHASLTPQCQTGEWILDNQRGDIIRNRPARPGAGHRRAFFRFVDELRRRQVCRALTMYAVILWLACQVIDILTPTLGLPDWTMNLLLVVGFMGLPITLVLAWLFDITPHGIVVEGAPGQTPEIASSRKPHSVDEAIDCALLLLALVISLQLATGAFSDDRVAHGTTAQELAILPFAAAGTPAEAFSRSLVSELQHEFGAATEYAVIDAREPFLNEVSRSLSGAVSANGNQVRVTVAMVDNSSGRVIWSGVFERQIEDSLRISSRIAADIVAALRKSSLASNVNEEEMPSSRKVSEREEFARPILGAAASGTESSVAMSHPPVFSDSFTDTEL